MQKEEIHDSVKAFKNFVNKYPELRKELRKSGRPWQEYYEKWVLLGEEDEYWEQFKENEMNQEQRSDDKDESNFELLSQLMKVVNNVDINKIQGQVNNLSKTITTVQELIDQFQLTKKDTSAKKNETFQWFRD